MKTPLVSVITPTFNRPELEKRAVASVLAQDFQEWEMIIFDASTCSEFEKWIRTQNDSRIRYDHTYNLHPTVRRFLMLKNANAPLIAFLDSDDFWTHDRLSQHYQVFQDHPDLALSWDHFFNFSETGELIAQTFQPMKQGYHNPPEMGKLNIRYGNFVHMSSFMAKTKALWEIGYPFHDFLDWNWGIEAGLRWPTFYIDKPLSYRSCDAPGRISDRKVWLRKVGRTMKWRLLRKYPYLLIPEMYRYFFTHGRKQRVGKYMPLVREAIFWP